MIEITKTSFEGLLLIKPKIHTDNRGVFLEAYNKNDFFDNDICLDFIQENQSVSKKNVLRGIHYQQNHPQTKIIRVVSGKIYDVAVDLRRESITFGKYFGIELSSENQVQLLIPKGFGHAFYVLSNKATVVYKVDSKYVPNDEGGIIWSDKTLNINWPLSCINPILSEKDSQYISFLELFLKN